MSKRRAAENLTEDELAIYQSIDFWSDCWTEQAREVLNAIIHRERTDAIATMYRHEGP